MPLLQEHKPHSELEEAWPKEIGLPIHSFFTGAGFLDLGFESEGFRTLSINESEKDFVDGYICGANSMGCEGNPKVYMQSIKDLLGSNFKINNGSKSATPIGFIGGPPCPDFSIAGKQKGKEGENGRLTGTYAELIKEKKPDWFLLENVRNLWAGKKHRVFYDQICSELIDSGYCLAAKLVNSLTYGVPQDRYRIILIGFKSSMIGEASARWLREEELAWEDYMSFKLPDVLLQPWPKHTKFGGRPYLPEGCERTLTVKHWFDQNEVDNHPNSEHFFVPRNLKRFSDTPEGFVSQKSFKRLHRWRFSPTSAYGNNEVHLHPYRKRRISVSEALAIQSLPKDFYLPADLSLSSMFKTIGNGVPFLMSAGIARMIRTFLNSKVS